MGFQEVLIDHPKPLAVPGLVAPPGPPFFVLVHVLFGKDKLDVEPAVLVIDKIEQPGIVLCPGNDLDGMAEMEFFVVAGLFEEEPELVALDSCDLVTVYDAQVDRLIVGAALDSQDRSGLIEGVEQGLDFQQPCRFPVGRRLTHTPTVL